MAKSPPLSPTLCSHPVLLFQPASCFPCSSSAFSLHISLSPHSWGNSKLSSHLGASPQLGLCVTKVLQEGPGKKKMKRPESIWNNHFPSQSLKCPLTKRPNKINKKKMKS
jgi:hypothetical protein